MSCSSWQHRDAEHRASSSRAHALTRVATAHAHGEHWHRERSFQTSAKYHVGATRSANSYSVPTDGISKPNSATVALRHSVHQVDHVPHPMFVILHESLNRRKHTTTSDRTPWDTRVCVFLPASPFDEAIAIQVPNPSQRTHTTEQSQSDKR